MAADAGARDPATAVWTLVFDGDCAFCRRCVAVLSRWDRRRRLRFVPFQDEAGLAGLPPIGRAALEQAMHLVSPAGAVFPGAEALPPILRLVPLGTPVSWLFIIPGVPWLAARAYRQVARNRHRLGCGSATCSLGR